MKPYQLFIFTKEKQLSKILSISATTFRSSISHSSTTTSSDSSGAAEDIFDNIVDKSSIDVIDLVVNPLFLSISISLVLYNQWYHQPFPELEKNFSECFRTQRSTKNYTRVGTQDMIQWIYYYEAILIDSYVNWDNFQLKSKQKIPYPSIIDP